jgi:hypothetical protein
MFHNLLRNVTRSLTNPMFAPAGALAFGLEIAAQTFGPTCFSVNGRSAGSWAPVAADMHNKQAQSAKARDSRLFAKEERYEIKQRFLLFSGVDQPR